MPNPKKPGRPATGAKPGKTYTTTSRSARAEAGGGRLSMNLTAEGAADLQAIISQNPGLTKTAAIHAALYAYRRFL